MSEYPAASISVPEMGSEVWHYTTFETFKKIWESQCLWATHYQFLNDSTELRYSKDHLSKILFPTVSKVFQEHATHDYVKKGRLEANGGTPGVTKRIIDKLFENVTSRCRGIYLTSFCRSPSDDEFINKHGLLSQWRGYGKNGIAIIFDEEKLAALYQQEDDKYEYIIKGYLDVVYSHTADEDQTLRECDETICTFAGKIIPVLLDPKKNLEKDEDEDKKVAYAFSRIMCAYKHPGFKEEQETRLIYAPAYVDERYQRHIESESRELKSKKTIWARQGCVPFIKLFEGFCSKRNPLPIKRIVVGPSPYQDRFMEFLNVALKYTGIEITASAIPYLEQHYLDSSHEVPYPLLDE